MNIGWLAHGSLGRRFAKTSFWSFIGTALARSSGLLTSIILARLLGKIGYGQLGIIVSTVGALNVVGNIGLGLTTTRYVSHLRDSDPDGAGRTAGSALLVAFFSYGICSLALFIFAPLLTQRMLNAPLLANDLRLASGMLLLGGIDGVQLGILAGLEAFRSIAKVMLLRGGVNLVVTFLCAWRFGFRGAVAAMVLMALFGALANHNGIRKSAAAAKVRIIYKFDRTQFKLLWSFSLPAFMVALLGLPSVWVVNAFLVNQPNGYQEMALLTAATQWGAVANLVPTVLSSAGVSIQSNLLGAGDHQNFHKMVRYNFLLQVGGMVSVVVLIMISSPWIMWFYGKDFSAGSSVLVIMCVGWVLMSVGSVFWDSMVSAGRIWWGFSFKLLSACVLLLASWWLIGIGARGVAIANVLSFGCFAVLQGGYYLWKRKAVLAGPLKQSDRSVSHLGMSA